MTDAVHAYGRTSSRSSISLGRQYTSAILGHQVSAPSPLACPTFDEVPHEMTKEEVWDNIRMFADAGRARPSGRL